VDQTLFGELEVLTKSGFGKFTDVTFLHALLAMQKRGVE
jgi:hypothetical protein